MDPKDREVCVCFHVPLGKLAKHHRLNHPRVASQMSECYGAGTGCGWCIPFLEQIYDQMRRGEEPTIRMSAEEYRRRRARFHDTGHRDLTGEAAEAKERSESAAPPDPAARADADSQIDSPSRDNPAPTFSNPDEANENLTSSKNHIMNILQSRSPQSPSPLPQTSQDSRTSHPSHPTHSPLPSASPASTPAVLRDVLIIGAGPIGLACAIEARRRGLSHVVLEKGCLANSIFHYPTAMRFFSTPDLLEIGGVPFVTGGEKPTRLEALEYYRRVAEGLELDVRLYETVLDVEGSDGVFQVFTTRGRYEAKKVIAAIGYFDRPRLLDVPGEDLAKVTHYYREAHLYAGQDLLIVGGGNSAVEAALECHRHGARVTMAVRGEAFHEGIKYWIRPDIENRVKSGAIAAHFRATVAEIRPNSVVLQLASGARPDDAFEIPNDFVLALTGYMPNYEFIRRLGVRVDDDSHRTPVRDPETWETNRPGLYLAGVVVGGMETKTWFIENSRAHAPAIFDDILSRPR